MKQKKINRRHFLAATTATGVFSIIPRHVLGGPNYTPPGNRITLGFIGVGGHGTGMNLKTFLRLPDAHAIAVCDVDTNRCKQARDMTNNRYQNQDCTAYIDFREIIARDDIDAVCISTPDHWHVPMSLMAIRAGKDVICEKPTLTIEQGRILSDTVKRYGAVFQTATEDRSIAIYHRMAELVRNGRIGKLQTVRVKLPAGQYGPTLLKAEPVPEGFDYDMWLGPASYAPYCKARCHWNFRWIFDYSGGQLTDWGAHLLDTAQWANDTEHTGPVQVEGKGKFPTEGLYNTAVKYHIEYKYANGVDMIVDSGGTALRFEGTEGWVGSPSWRRPLQASSDSILKSVIGPEEIHLFTCPQGEQRDFLDCVKSRKDPYFPAEIGHRCSSVMHTGNISMLLGRKLRWNPDKEEFINDEQANRMRSRAMRPPWRL